MQACRRTARNAYRRALRADLDASPCRWFAPRRLCIEGPGPPLPLIREGATAFDARPFFDSTSVVIFNILDSRGPGNPNSALACDADPDQTDATVGAGCSESTELRTIIPLQHRLDHRVTAPQR